MWLHNTDAGRLCWRRYRKCHREIDARRKLQVSYHHTPSTNCNKFDWPHVSSSSLALNGLSWESFSWMKSTKSVPCLVFINCVMLAAKVCNKACWKCSKELWSMCQNGIHPENYVAKPYPSILQTFCSSHLVRTPDSIDWLHVVWMRRWEAWCWRVVEFFFTNQFSPFFAIQVFGLWNAGRFIRRKASGASIGCTHGKWPSRTRCISEKSRSSWFSWIRNDSGEFQFKPLKWIYSERMRN